MATKLSIYNLAFAHLSEPTVTSLTEDPVAPNVAKANALWEDALDGALARAPWLCALESPTLPEDVPPAGGWSDHRYPHRFTCPTGTLKIWSVAGWPDDAWQAGVAMDANGASRKVIKAAWGGSKPVDLVMRRPPEALTPLLVKGLGLDLASLLAGPIQQNEGKAERLARRAAEAYLMAEAAEASEIGGQEPVLGMGGLYYARLSAH